MARSRPAAVPKSAWLNTWFDVWIVNRRGGYRALRDDGSLHHTEDEPKTGPRTRTFYHLDGKTLAGVEKLTTMGAESFWLERSAGCAAKQERECRCAQLAPKVWRAEQAKGQRTPTYRLEDGRPCDERGRPTRKTAKPTAVKPPKPVKPKPATHPLAKQFRALEALLHNRGLGWMVHFAPKSPKSPRWTEGRLPSFAKRMGEHLPDSYRAFVEEIGYPMIGAKLYCDLAWSFLPPALAARISGDLPGPDDSEPAGAYKQVFFAATLDSADITGYSFLAGKVHAIHDALVERKPIGTFDAWLTRELARLTKWANKISLPTANEMREADDSEKDPHRLLG